MSKKGRKVAILGTTPSRGLAPVNDDTWEIWTIGPGGKDAHRWDRLFETHRVWPLNFGELENGKSYLDDLSQIKKPQVLHTIVDMKEHTALWAKEHGKDEVFLKNNIRGNWSAQKIINRDVAFDTFTRAMFQSSIDYCLYQAYEEDYETVGLFGIDLESGEEYISQHWSCAQWMLLHRLKGVDLVLPEASGLERDISPYPDRYETHFALHCEKKINYLNQINDQAEQELENVKKELYRGEGLLILWNEIMGWEKIPESKPERRQQVEEHIQRFQNSLWQVHGRKNQIQGELNALKHMRSRFTWGMQELE